MYFRRSLSCIGRSNRAPWFLPTSAPLSIYFHGTLSSFYQRARGLKWANGETVKRRETKGGDDKRPESYFKRFEWNVVLLFFFFFQDSTSGYRTCKTFVEWRRMKNCVSSNMVTRLPYFCSSKIITSLIKPCAHLTLQILWTRAYL